MAHEATNVGRVTDPEDVTEPQPADLAEAEVDELPDDTRPRPLEADDADIDDLRVVVDLDDDDVPEPGVGF
jgi:hypothetical protein